MRKILAALGFIIGVLTCGVYARADVPSVPGAASLSSTGNTSALYCTGGQSSVAVQVTGTFTGLTLVPQGSVNNLTYSTLPNVTNISAAGLYTLPLGAVPYFRLNASALASGTAIVNFVCNGSAPGALGFSSGTSITATVSGTANVNVTQVASTVLVNPWLPTGAMQDSAGLNRQSVFADNPSNSSCNSSTAGQPCIGTLTTTSTDGTKVVQGVSSDYVYIPRLHFWNTSATTVTITMTEGTHTTVDCDTGIIKLGTWIVPAGLGIVVQIPPEAPLFTEVAGDSVCLNISANATSVGYNFPIAITPLVP